MWKEISFFRPVDGKRVPLFLLEIARFAVWSWVGRFFSSGVFLLGFLYVETLSVKREFF